MGSQAFKEFREKVGVSGNGAFKADEEAPEGTHLATVAVALASETKAHDWRVRVKFVVDSGPHAGTATWWGKNYQPDQEDSLKWFFGFTDVMGVDWDAAGDFDHMDAKAVTEIVAAQLAGKRAQIKCQKAKKEFPTGSGVFPVEVKFVNPVPAGSPEPQVAQRKAGTAKVASAPKPPTGPTPPSVPNPIRDAL